MKKNLYSFANIELSGTHIIKPDKHKKYILTLRTTTFPSILGGRDNIESIKEYLKGYKAINVSAESQIIMSNAEFNNLQAACNSFQIKFTEDNVIINPIIDTLIFRR